jgi:hypothetical protein
MMAALIRWAAWSRNGNVTGGPGLGGRNVRKHSGAIDGRYDRPTSDGIDQTRQLAKLAQLAPLHRQ